MKLIVVSGVSGSGKSTVLHVFEDMGFYCIDNLPVGLLPAFSEQMATVLQNYPEKAAIGIDARNIEQHIQLFPSALDELKKSGISCDVIFLTADKNILLKRFSETRRKHPLTQINIPLSDAIENERKLLKPISDNADVFIDTSQLNIHQLRDLVKTRFRNHPPKSLSILFQSFGFKHGVPGDADFVFDSRCLPNPHWIPELRQKTGMDSDVISFLDKQPLVTQMYEEIREFLNEWVPHFEADNRNYLTVAIGCTGGQHRSVYLVERLVRYFNSARENVITRHRELT